MLLEQMYQDLTEQLPALKEALAQGVEYGGDLAHRFIVYDIWMQSLGIGIALMVLIVMTYYARKTWKDAKWDSYQGPENLSAAMFMVLAVATFVFILISPLLLGTAVQNLIKDIFIPEVRIIEVLSNLIQ